MLPLVISFSRLAATSLAALWLLGCASPASAPSAWQAQLARWASADVLLLGEQHDAAAHQRWQEDTVRWLSERGRLGALVLEMAELGTRTDGLARDASDTQVRTALQWDDAAWPWQRYGPVVMAAVTAGVPVRGGNLPRPRMREAMQDSRYDAHLPPSAHQRQLAAMADGHCGLLPESRLVPMLRIQRARDASLAQAVQDAHAPGRTVVLVAGHGHVQRSLGVPMWLPPDFKQKVAIAQAGQAPAAIESEADYIHHTPALPPLDHCAELRARWPAARSP